MVKNLIVKYPFILCKDEAQINEFFQILNKNGVTTKKAMYSLIECPKLISLPLDKQIKDIVFLFELYHNISQEETIQIFKAFPYTLCLSPRKIQRFLGEFRKYRMNN